MLMLNEFKKNIGFFILMALVLTLLMSAGASLFNFSFEIRKEIDVSLSENFEYGYDININEFIDPAVEKLPGVDYYSYYTMQKTPYPLLEDMSLYGSIEKYEENVEYPRWINSEAYYFEDSLPKKFLKAQEKIDNFWISGSPWNNTDNDKIEGKYPIFISEDFASGKVIRGWDKNEVLLDYGELKVGDTFSLTEISYDYELNEIIENGAVIEFIVNGIYRIDNPESEGWINLPDTVIPLNAEMEYYKFYGDDYNKPTTKLTFNNLNNFKKFSSFAKKNNIEYDSYIEEDIKVISLFSSLFIVISVAMLILSGFVSFVYCRMFVNRRLNYIGLLKAFGLPDVKIAKQFFILLIIVFGFSFILGNVFSYLLTSRFAELALTLFNYKLNTGFNWLSQALFGILTLLTALVNALFLYRRIKKISTAQVLIQKE